ncbi:MAG TPA: hypothetical protein VD996_06540 [Chitinophagaceae bacterium]|nr:hypothetical protein [Chitinophagaceae bacterium]
MRKELFEIMQIDHYLLGGLSADERTALDARRIIDPAFSEKIEAQQHVHRLVRLFARKQNKRMLQSMYTRLMNESSFKQQVNNIFS